MVACSVSGLPVRWKCICRMTSDPFGSGSATPGGQEHRRRADGPAAERPDAPWPPPTPAVPMPPNPGLPSLPSCFAARAARVVGEEHVVDGLARAGPELDGADPLVLGEARRDRRSCGRCPDRSRAARRRRASSARDRACRGASPRGTAAASASCAGSPCGMPCLTHSPIVAICASVRRRSSCEVAVAVRRVPGRHVARLGDRGDQLALLLRVVVGDERERRRLAGAMAGDAVLVEDRARSSR